MGLPAPSQGLVPVLGHSDPLSSHLLSGRNLERLEAGLLVPCSLTRGWACRWAADVERSRRAPSLHPPGPVVATAGSGRTAPRTTCAAPFAWLNPPHPTPSPTQVSASVSSSKKASWTQASQVPAQLPALGCHAQAVVMGLWEVCQQYGGVRLQLWGGSAALGPWCRAGSPGQLGHGCRMME